MTFCQSSGKLVTFLMGLGFEEKQRCGWCIDQAVWPEWGGVAHVSKSSGYCLSTQPASGDVALVLSLPKTQFVKQVRKGKGPSPVSDQTCDLWEGEFQHCPLSLVQEVYPLPVNGQDQLCLGEPGPWPRRPE